MLLMYEMKENVNDHTMQTVLTVVDLWICLTGLIDTNNSVHHLFSLAFLATNDSTLRDTSTDKNGSVADPSFLVTNDFCIELVGMDKKTEVHLTIFGH